MALHRFSCHLIYKIVKLATISKTKIMKSIFYLLLLGFFSCSQTKPQSSSEVTETKPVIEKTAINKDNLKEAVFGMGCFWCSEAIFEALNGVVSVEAGYTGGKTKNPTYDDVSNKETGHAEVALIKYDPSIIDYKTLLDVFWTTHDPTTLNRQGADYGTQYRSAIFYENEKQREIAEKSKKEVAPMVWDNPIVTEITPLKQFYPAEEYHQDFYKNNPDYGYCVAVINPKLEKLYHKFEHLLKKDATPSLASKPLLSKDNYNKLSKFDYNIIENKGTERAFSGAYWNHKKDGIYICKRCNQPLFKSDAKFDSKTGWPSFDDVYSQGAVKEVTDQDGYRTEIVCGHCGAHLGHVFKGEGFTSKNTRHCVNSASLEFVTK